MSTEVPANPPPQPSWMSLALALVQRRVPQILAIYAGASWGLVEFTSFVVDEFALPPHWTRMVLITVLLLLPSVLLLAWFHGKPGRDRESLARTEKIGIPANLVLCVVAVWTLTTSTGDEASSAMSVVKLETEAGDVLEREVPNAGLRKAIAFFPVNLGPGVGEDQSWISYALPEALVLDLMSDNFFEPITTFGYESDVRERGFESFAVAPAALKRALARELNAGFLAYGDIDWADDRFRATLQLFRVEGSLVAKTVHEGADLLALVDEMAEHVKTVLKIPARQGIEDLPVRERLSDDNTAVEAFFKGLFHRFARRDTDAAIGHLTAATSLDPSFAIAQYNLSQVLRASGEDGAAVMGPLMAAIEHQYRMPERYGFEVKADYYTLIGEMDRAAAVVETWVALYPSDLTALRAQVGLQVRTDDWDGVLATLATIRRLDPLDGTPILLMAQAQEQLGNDAQARSLLTEYSERFPEDAFGYARLASFHRKRGRHEDARQALERAIALEPLSLEYAMQLAESNLDVGRLDEARAGYERLLAQARTGNERVRVLSRLTHYHHRRGEMAEAIHMIESRLQEEGNFRTSIEIAWGRIADIAVYLEARRIDEAVELLDDLRTVFHESPPRHLLRLAAHVALEAEGVDAALEAHSQATEVYDAGGIGDRRPDLLAVLGMIQDRAGDHHRAAETFRAAVALSPQARLYRGAGRALRMAGRLDEAEAELHEALRLVPSDPHAHLEMGLLMEARGDFDASVDHLAHALEVWENADQDFEPARQTRAKLEKLVARFQ